MTATATEKKSILICDDNGDIVDFIQALLLNAGYDVRTACNATDFLNDYGTKRPDLIILDVRMPERDGFWVAEQLLDRRNKAPIIFLTAHDCFMYRLYAPVAGAADYLTKPVDPDLLLEHVAKALKRGARESNWMLQSLDYTQRSKSASADDEKRTV